MCCSSLCPRLQHVEAPDWWRTCQARPRCLARRDEGVRSDPSASARLACLLPFLRLPFLLRLAPVVRLRDPRTRGGVPCLGSCPGRGRVVAPETARAPYPLLLHALNIIANSNIVVDWALRARIPAKREATGVDLARKPFPRALHRPTDPELARIVAGHFAERVASNCSAIAIWVDFRCHARTLHGRRHHKPCVGLVGREGNPTQTRVRAGGPPCAPLSRRRCNVCADVACGEADSNTTDDSVQCRQRLDFVGALAHAAAPHAS